MVISSHTEIKQGYHVSENFQNIISNDIDLQHEPW